MGRITIFSTDGCPHCKRVKVALLSRDIPFVDISITKHPQKRQDMMALSDRVSTPQVFFNTRHVGGADETLALLDAWDKEQRFSSPLERYQAEIANHFDPSNPRLAIPTDDPIQPESSPARGDAEFSIVLPRGATAQEERGREQRGTVLQVTELLKKILPSQDNIRKLTRHKMSFTGKQAVRAFCDHFNITPDEAVAFGSHLQEQQILHSIRDKMDFENSENLFRLQCYSSPDILNSYRIWTEKADPDPIRLLNRLMHLMAKIEGIQTNDQAGIDYGEAVKLPLYSVFEENVCELQSVDLKSMDEKTKTAFGINLYNLMIKYAFMKVGAGTNDFSRLVFYNSVKFYIGKFTFSFQDLENGILRGNRKAPYALRLQFDKKDPRLDLIVKDPDCRVHFALNCGAKSCPPVSTYAVETLDEDLAIAANSFCESDHNVRVDTENNTLHLSTIFHWYRVDFARNNKELPGAVLKFLRRVKHQELDRLLDAETKVKVVFEPYDWSKTAQNVKTFDASEFNTESRTLKGLWGSRRSEVDANKCSADSALPEESLQN